MLNPLARWTEFGEKPEYAGPLSFGGAPYIQDPSDSSDADVAIIGAPMDDLVSDRPETRFAPRTIRGASCPPGPHLEAGFDASEELRVVDFGDAPVVPADPARSHAAIERTVGQALSAGAIPMILGGDHSVTEANVRACAAVHGPVTLVHFNIHTDTGSEVFGAERSHGTMMLRLIEGEEVFSWQREQGITSLFIHDVTEFGMREVVRRAVEAVGKGPVFLSVDIDVLNPAFAPGNGTPEPGGTTTADLMWAARNVTAQMRLVGAELVETIPTGVGSADVIALAADRIVREALTGLALRKRAHRTEDLGTG